MRYFDRVVVDRIVRDQPVNVPEHEVPATILACRERGLTDNQIALRIGMQLRLVRAVR